MKIVYIIVNQNDTNNATSASYSIKVRNNTV